MDPKKIAIADYSYNLPDEKIASYPLQERDASKLLVYQNGLITEDIYRNIADHIPSNSLLVFNNTKVIEARLLFQKPTGGIIEIFCLEPHEQYPDVLSAMQQTKTAEWKCLIGGASKWKAGQILEKKIKKHDEEIILHAKFISKQKDDFIIQLSWLPENMIFAEVLHAAGAIPLPPYIKRAAEEKDAERYQTVYAHHDGSVAAPTAGLHFTEKIFQDLAAKNIEHEFVTLHVGAGTFKPVNTEIIEHHEMHAEYIQVSIAALHHLLNACDKNIIAVGTTSLRTLETLYWLGVKTIIDPAINIHDLQLSQWEVYEINKKNIAVKEALQALINWMGQQHSDILFTKTQMIITPGYEIKMAKALVTNFHQPQSTLLLLVAAMAGDDWKKIYQHALQNDFRFLSYGDGSLIWLKSC
jgi:S-adenosylmethionine:tRNA ribosyltransferase-isomerase